MIKRADIEGSKSNVAMNARLPQASYPCGNFSDTSTKGPKNQRGSFSKAFSLINYNMLALYQYALNAITKRTEKTL